MDGAGVIAAQSYRSADNRNGVFLISASTELLKTISYGKSSIFGQPVFADNYLLIASTGGQGLTAYKAR